MPTCPSRARWIAQADVAPCEQPSGTRQPSSSRRVFLLVHTHIPPDTLVAYRAPDDRVGHGRDRIIVRLETRSDALARRYVSSGYTCGACLTAYNPLARPTASRPTRRSAPVHAAFLSKESYSYASKTKDEGISRRSSDSSRAHHFREEASKLLRAAIEQPTGRAAALQRAAGRATGQVAARPLVRPP